MANQRQITAEQAKAVGAALGVDWTRIDLEQFRHGLEVELEHGTRDLETNVTDDDMGLPGKIAWAHLKELPDYYSPLERLEAVADDDGMAMAAVDQSPDSQAFYVDVPNQRQ